MIEDDFILAQSDLNARERLQGFLPQRIFDMHMHVHRADFCPTMCAEGSIFQRSGETGSMGEYVAHQGPLYGDGKLLRANMIIMPDGAMGDPSNGLRDTSTRFLAEELEKYPENIGEVIVLAEDSRAAIESQLIHPRIKGLKCYHSTARKAVTWQLGIGEYLPEAAWEVAEDKGLCITLHMVRDKAIADEGNLAYIKEKAARYPHAKLILAHAARSFAAWTAMESVAQLAEYPNILFDIAVICEAPPIFEVIRRCGAQRVFWGSDYPISMFRGKCISIADSFLWLYKEQLSHCTGATAFNVNLIGTEALSAFYMASQMLELSRSDIEDIFYNNAIRLFDLQA